MLGLVLRAAGLDMGGGGMCGIVLVAVLGIVAMCGLYKCSQLGLRDCKCCKRWMLVTGSDGFDDFQVTFLVSECMYTSSTHNLSTLIKITAGSYSVATDPNNHGVYHQPVELFVEQGTEEIKVELMDASAKRVLAVKKFNIVTDILKSPVHDKETIFQMKQSSKTLLNPKLKMTIFLQTEDNNDVEAGLLKNLNISPEASVMLKQQIHKERLHKKPGDGSETESVVSAPGQAPQPTTELDLLYKVCAGPLEQFGSWGKTSSVYISHRGPPETRRHVLAIWDKDAYERGEKPFMEIDILKILSVAPDPHPRRNEVFILQYMNGKKRERLTFRRIDRARDMWVEMIQVMIKASHAQRDDGRKDKSMGHSKTK